jgi:hypothetical protein
MATLPLFTAHRRGAARTAPADLKSKLQRQAVDLACARIWRHASGMPPPPPSSGSSASNASSEWRNQHGVSRRHVSMTRFQALLASIIAARPVIAEPHDQRASMARGRSAPTPLRHEVAHRRELSAAATWGRVFIDRHRRSASPAGPTNSKFGALDQLAKIERQLGLARAVTSLWGGCGHGPKLVRAAPSARHRFKNGKDMDRDGTRRVGPTALTPRASLRSLRGKLPG